jgi:hypothetical protein
MQAAIALYVICGLGLMLIVTLGIGSLWQRYMVSTYTWVCSMVAYLVVMAYATRCLITLIA